MSEKAYRKALLTVKRLNRDTGGDARLKGAIDNFGQQRQQRFNQPANDSQSAALGLDTSYANPPQLLVAEPPQQQRSNPQGMVAQTADLGSALDDGIGMLTGRGDAKPAPAKGAPAAQGAAPAQGQPSHPVSATPPSKDQQGAAFNMIDRLVKVHGWTPEAASIAAGNAMQESSFDPAAGGDPSIPGGSHGMFQWNRDRLANLQNYAKSQGANWQDPNTQIDYFAQEAKKMVPDWPSQTDLSQARPISKAYEGYGVEGNRVPDAQNIYKAYQNRPQPTGGPVSSADIPQDADVPQAKRGGFMRKHFDDGGSSGDGGGGDGSGGDGSAGSSAATAAGMAAGYGGVGNSAGAPAGTSTNGTGGFGAGMGGGSGNNGFGGNSGFSSSVGMGSPSGSPSGTAAGFGNTGFGGASAGSATGFGGNGGNGNAAAGAGGAGHGGTGGGGGTASGGSGISGVHTNGTPMYGGVPAFYDAGFGLGKSGRGNSAAAQSTTAFLDSLRGTQMQYGFVNGNDPGLANSATGQAALAQAPSNPYSSPAYAQAVAQFRAGMAAQAGQGFGNAGFGGGSPTASVGGFGGNSAPTGAVSTAGLGTSPTAQTANNGFSSPQAAQQFAHAATLGDAQASGYSNSNAVQALRGTPQQQTAYAAQQTGQQQQAPAHAAVQTAQPPHGGRAQQRGGMVQRASGGQISSTPTNDLIATALKIVRRQKAAQGGTTKQDTFNAIASRNPKGAASLANDATVSAINGVNTNGTPNVIQVPNYYNGMSGTDSAASPAPTAAASPNTPALGGQNIGNASGATGAPLGVVPMASPTGGQGMPGSPAAASGTPTYSNTLDEALGTNNPTMNQIFGFNYPVPPPSKPQPQGPVSQAQINAQYGIGGGSQIGTGVFASGGAIIMDALTRANRQKRSRKSPSK